MTVLEFVEHAFNRIVIMREGFTHTVRKPRIVDQITQTLARERQVICTVVRVGLSLGFVPGPGPFWQRGERPFQYVH